MKINKKRNHFSRQIKKPVEEEKFGQIKLGAVEADKPKEAPQTADSVKAALGGKSEGKIGDVWHKIKAGQVITGKTRKEVREAAKAIA